MEPTTPNVLHHRWLIGIGVVAVAFGLLWLSSGTASADECSSGDWPAFMLPVGQKGIPNAPQGWILWCNERHWTLQVAGEIAGETESRRARGERVALFDWFDPSLTADEAWVQLSGTSKKRTVKPRHRMAVLAFTTKTEMGRYRLELSSEGIPVFALVPGDDGFSFWASVIDRAGRSMWSDDDVMNFPACTEPGQNGSISEPQPCWLNGGATRPDGRCFENLAKLTAEFQTLGCSI